MPSGVTLTGALHRRGHGGGGVPSTSDPLPLDRGLLWMPAEQWTRRQLELARVPASAWRAQRLGEHYHHSLRSVVEEQSQSYLCQLVI